jgi:hypothetical protein
MDLCDACGGKRLLLKLSIQLVRALAIKLGLEDGTNLGEGHGGSGVGERGKRGSVGDGEDGGLGAAVRVRRRWRGSEGSQHAM